MRAFFVLLSLSFSISLAHAGEDTALERLFATIELREDAARGEGRMRKEDLRRAVEAFQKIIEDLPGDKEISAKALLHMAIAFELLDEDSKAFDVYEGAVKAYPDLSKAVSFALHS